MKKTQTKKPRPKKIQPKLEVEVQIIDIKINFLGRLSQQFKVIGVVVFFLSLPMAFSLFYPQPAEKTMYPAEPISGEEKEAVVACRLGGGEWQQFSSSCADFCPNQIGEPVCAQVLTEGCDCGAYECWTGEECVLPPDQ